MSATPTPQGKRRGLTPCAVIVDTRNVNGMLNDLFGGSGHRVTGEGIRKAMRFYNLNVREIHAGIATEPRGSATSERMQSMLRTNRAYRDALTADNVNVPEGYLAERRTKVEGKTKVEEKMVDVLLALQVADICDRIREGKTNVECIVMMTEDMDLIPAYKYAEERGVTVYAAAINTHHHREDQNKWLLLHEEAVRTISGVDSSMGSPTRTSVARVALGENRPPLPTKWRSRWDQRPGEVVLYNNKRVRGHIYSPTAVMRDERLDLHAAEIHFAEDRGDLFPSYKLQTTAPAPGPFAGVNAATVTAWISPTTVKATFDDDKACTLTIAPGSVLVGDKIAVFTTKRDSGLAHYYIGPVASWTSPEDWPLRTAIANVTLTHAPNGDPFWHTTLDGHPNEVHVHSYWLKHAKVGDRLMVALTGTDTATGSLQAMPLSCCLP